jgi:hypothetical protein
MARKPSSRCFVETRRILSKTGKTAEEGDVMQSGFDVFSLFELARALFGLLFSPFDHLFFR